jgi:predicted DNA-binding transcriptional regulator AlpA
MRSERLQDKYAYAPRGLRADNAAAYLGMGKTKFLELVASGAMPSAVVIDGMRVWDRLELDAAFETAKAEQDVTERNSFDKVLRIVR